MRKGEFEKAVADFTAAIRLLPAHAGLRAHRAEAHLHSRDNQRAIVDFSEAIKLAPQNASYRAFLEFAQKGGVAQIKAADGTPQIGLVLANGRAGTMELFLVNSDGSGATDLTRSNSDNRMPAWSPDGKRIAFASDRDAAWNIYVMDADGSNVQRLTTGTASNNCPSWSADGNTLAFVRSGEKAARICVMQADGGNFREVRDGNDPALSPDGTKILFTVKTGRSQLLVTDLAGTSVKELAATDVAHEISLPAWSPDGHKIAWTQGVGYSTEIFVADADADGKNARKLTDLGGINVGPSWSPDGKELVFTHQHGPDGRTYCILNIERGEVRQLLSNVILTGTARAAWRTVR